MKTTELRLVIAAVFAAPSQTFATDLHSHVWGLLYGGFQSPLTVSHRDLCRAWHFSLSTEQVSEGTKATITVEACYDMEDAETMIKAIRQEMPDRLAADLTVKGNRPTHTSLEEVVEHPYNASVPRVLMAA